PDKQGSSSSARTPSTPKLSNSANASRGVDPARVEKRRQNTLAARRYRQKRVDQVTTLESALKETQSDRDALKIRVARLEGEVETLRQLLSSKS
ncbi:putative bZIP transcription factor JlbA, partial [Clohesyomyces aquaticus]